MYYRITDNVALRRWSDLGFAVYWRGVRSAFPLSAKQAAVMLLCDGEHDIETDDTVMLLVLKKLIEPCEKGEQPTAWSAFRSYDNVYFPMMNLMITGKCNFNQALPLDDDECAACLWLPVCAGGCPYKRLVNGKHKCLPYKNEPEEYVLALWRDTLARKSREERAKETSGLS